MTTGTVAEHSRAEIWIDRRERVAVAVAWVVLVLGLALGATVLVTVEPSGYAEFAGWRVPDWSLLLVLPVQVGTLWVICCGREPWRATRWAWFWLSWLLPPVGALAFLLLGGSTARWRPRRPERRLTAGWAFLLFLGVRAG